MTSSDFHNDHVSAGSLEATIFVRKPTGYEAFISLRAIIKEQLG